MKHDNITIAKAVATKIGSVFDHSVEAKPFDEGRSRSGNTHFSLPIQNKFGIFDMVIAEAWLRVSAGEVTSKEGETQTSVQIALHYKHVGGGSNGSNIGTLWLNEKGRSVAFREG